METVNGYRLILGYIGYIMMLAGVIILLPLLVLISYPDDAFYANCFIVPGVLSVFEGYLMTSLIRNKERGRLHKGQDILIVLLTWIMTILAGAAPYYLSRQYSVTRAIFESASGFTTTGLTVTPVDIAPHIFLMYRSMTLFFGGVGLILIVTSIISEVYGMQLYTAEGHLDRLMPNLAASARTVLVIYSGFIFIGVLLYVWGGMSWFDAVNYSMSAVSTGGFATHSDSIAHFNSRFIEGVTIILMLIGGTNFNLLLITLRGNFKALIKHCETRFSFWLYLAAVPLLTLLLYRDRITDFWDSAHMALFQCVSAVTTTGLDTSHTLDKWPTAQLILMMMLMLVGGAAGSTAGGIKQFRLYIITRRLVNSFRERLAHKRIVFPNTVNIYGKNTRMDDNITDICLYTVLYIAVCLLGAFAFSLYNQYNFTQCIFDFTAALTSGGYSNGVVGPASPRGILWISVVAMFLGRLEIYVVIIGILRIFSDIRAKITKMKY